MTEPVSIQAPNGGRRVWRRYVAPVLVAASLLWVIWLLKGSWATIAESLRHVSIQWLLAGLVLGALATWLSFLSFTHLLQALGAPDLPLSRKAHLYFSAQLMKHLPGRVLGVAYQITATKGKVPVECWISANGAHLLLMLYMALFLPCAVLLARDQVAAASGLALLSVLLVLSSWPRRLAACAASWAKLSTMRVARVIVGLLQPIAASQDRQYRRAVLLLVLSWVPYFMAWGLYATAHPTLGFEDGVRLCATYTLAWVLGYISFLTPSGLGVRELAFAWFAAAYPPDVVAYGIVIGRASLMIIDVAFSTLFLRSERGDD